MNNSAKAFMWWTISLTYASLIIVSLGILSNIHPVALILFIVINGLISKKQFLKSLQSMDVEKEDEQ